MKHYSLLVLLLHSLLRQPSFSSKSWPCEQVCTTALKSCSHVVYTEGYVCWREHYIRIDPGINLKRYAMFFYNWKFKSTAVIILTLLKGTLMTCKGIKKRQLLNICNNNNAARTVKHTNTFLIPATKKATSYNYCCTRSFVLPIKQLLKLSSNPENNPNRQMTTDKRKVRKWQCTHTSQKVGTLWTVKGIMARINMVISCPCGCGLPSILGPYVICHFISKVVREVRTIRFLWGLWSPFYTDQTWHPRI